MKKVNKVIALVLAVAMLASFGAISASALSYNGNGTSSSFTLRYQVGGTEVMSASSGDIIDLYINITTDCYAYAFMINLNYDFGKVTQIRQGGTTVQSITSANMREILGEFKNTAQVDLTEGDLYDLDDANGGYGYYLPWGVGALTCFPHNDNFTELTKWTAEEKAQYKMAKLQYTTKADDQTLLVNTHGVETPVVRWRFIALSDIADLSTAIFFSPAEKAAIEYYSNNTPFSNLITSTCTLGVGKAVRIPTTTVYSGCSVYARGAADTRVRWNATDPTHCDLGFTGVFTLPAVTNDGTNITAGIKGAGIVFSTTVATPTKGAAECTDVPTYALYDQTNSVYMFRAVLGNFATDDTTDYNVRAYITLDNDTVIYSDVVTTNAAAHSSRLP